MKIFEKIKDLVFGVDDICELKQELEKKHEEEKIKNIEDSISKHTKQKKVRKATKEEIELIEEFEDAIEDKEFTKIK